ncbi:hypothetical protein CGLAU_03365 [Corynebacterium glaucum]|uniref:Helicase XPB/Ssl2 N-terminal domain-containing protein n=1 Tax=Corynebacterium glaucum TaxID=187491 RepID=A0A1Q2HUZ0_9CORY|nr:helicase-associated domain-containing protein [Corynebacterium glaucum]AQQ14653.1 hypothetical protein CGLAU_03365 [Corynebacterium glaucum]
MSTFTQALTELSEEELKLLIDARPDAFFPTPPSLGSLATRLSLPGSVALALRSLNAADLRALERLADAGAELDPVDASLGERPDALPGNLTRLRERALVYGPDTAVRIAPGTLSALPPGWRISDTAPDDLEARLAALPARERQVLETLANAGGVGTTKSAATDANPDTPVARLIAAGFLVRADSSTVRLPRPIRDVLAGHRPRIFPTEPPALPEADLAEVNEIAASQGLEAVRQLRQLITALLARPVALNKDGTVGVRVLAALEKELGFDPSLLITIGESAGLIGRGSVDNADVLAATRDALSWLDATLSDQWAVLLAGWVASPWRIDTGHKLLSAESHVPELRHARATILRHGGEMQQLLFHAPLAASGMRDALIDAVVAEGQAVGALAQHVPSSPATALLDGSDVAAAAKDLVPDEVGYVIAQADMTVLAPGPLTPEAARFIERIADLESPGLASVWRVTEASIRNALDSGLTSAQMHDWLAEHVVGEVPQGISFLIDDVARTHGSIRAGSALSYVRSDDEALIATAAQQCGLRVLAPTVAVSELPLGQLIAALREAGLQPIAEDAQGIELNVAPEPSLVPATPSTLPRPRTVDPAQRDRIVETLRSGATEDSAPAEQSDTLETLRAAARGRRHVTLGYVDKSGRGRTLTVLPLSVNAGQVDALDEATERVVRIALPRITRVTLA